MKEGGQNTMSQTRHPANFPMLNWVIDCPRQVVPAPEPESKGCLTKRSQTDILGFLGSCVLGISDKRTQIKNRSVNYNLQYTNSL
jgi:hypothetical protein